MPVGLLLVGWCRIRERMSDRDSETVWRYMDVATYVATLANGLFFARPFALGDDWEGAWGVGDVSAWRKDHGKPPAAEVQQRWQTRLAEKGEAISRYGVSCWHASPIESAALWAHYARLGLGVAIQSTPQRLAAALGDRAPGLRTLHVQYVDYATVTLGDDPLDLLSRKRLEFEHEREVRFVLPFTEAELDAMEAFRRLELYRQARSVLTGAPRALVRGLAELEGLDLSVFAQESASPAGVTVQVDTEELIAAVILSPRVSYPLRRAVRRATEAFGLAKSLVRESGMDQKPPDVLRFYDN
jgi:hypothetical protein